MRMLAATIGSEGTRYGSRAEQARLFPKRIHSQPAMRDGVLLLTGHFREGEVTAGRNEDGTA
jgi:hypothetical protein